VLQVPEQHSAGALHGLPVWPQPQLGTPTTPLLLPEEPNGAPIFMPLCTQTSG
jgi:hypothetical protein